MAQELIIKDGEYAIDKPSKLVGMAQLLKQHIVTQKLYTPIAGKNYAHVEGWQFAGGLLGIYPKIHKVENLSQGQEMKWLAEVHLIERTTDKVVGVGIAVCSNKENKKKNFDEYAILSMAQTRAIGKAYRNLIGWVMKLAGYEATPSEEMVRMGDAVPAPKPAENLDEKFKNHKECANCGEMVNEIVGEYSKKHFKKVLCRNCQPQKNERINKSKIVQG